MSAAIRERTTTRTSSSSRNIVSHGSSPISGQGHIATSANSLENNLDALLEDLQTSVSRSATPSRGRPISPQVEYRVPANTTKVLSEARPISPNRTTMTSTEKYVSSGPSGTPTGIPGLEFIDSELQNVQPGQSKTIAYKQVSYQYNKSLDGKPVDSWATSDNALTNSSSTALIDDIRERTYQESMLQHRDPVITKELVYSDKSTSRSKQSSPLPPTQKEVKYIHESSSYETEPVDRVPIIQPGSASIPINLAPGPNTKVTTTIKTYTYELPGAPESYLPGSGVPCTGPVVLPGDQTITYTLPKGASTDKTVSYQRVTENKTIPSRYGSPTPIADITKKSTTLHQESKFYVEEQIPSGRVEPSQQPNYYRPNSPPDGVVSNYERYYTVDTTAGYTDDHRPDHPGIIYQNQQHHHQTSSINETTRTEERNLPAGKPGTPVKNYYPVETTPHPQSTTTIYKFSNQTTIVPPNKSPEDHELLLPKPFPVETSMLPQKPAEQCPPKKLEDLMASFSDTEREVLEGIEKRERVQPKEPAAVKKEVDFIPHSPPKVKSQNVAGPPVYYPPGSAEFTKKEESGMAMSQSGGGWQKASAKYEYEASSKSKSKTKSGGAVVPVCLPLCCAMPCVLM